LLLSALGGGFVIVAAVESVVRTVVLGSRAAHGFVGSWISTKRTSQKSET